MKIFINFFKEHITILIIIEEKIYIKEIFLFHNFLIKYNQYF